MFSGSLVLIGIGVAAYYLWRRAHEPGRLRAGGRDEAIEILKRRYAGGEITREEFEEKQRDLAA